MERAKWNAERAVIWSISPLLTIIALLPPLTCARRITAFREAAEARRGGLR